MVALIQIDSGHPSELAHFQPFKNLLFRPFQQVKIFRAERQISERSEVIRRVTKFFNFLSKFFFVKLKWFNSLKLPKLAFAKLSNFGLLFFYLFLIVLFVPLRMTFYFVAISVSVSVSFANLHHGRKNCDLNFHPMWLHSFHGPSQTRRILQDKKT